MDKVIDISKRCGAKKKNGELCKKWPEPNRNRCKFHGGATIQAGPNHPTYKHGKYSKALPKNLLQQYEKSLTDTTLLSLRHEISVIDSRLIELLTKVDQGEAGALWTKLKNKYKEYSKEDDVTKKMLLEGELSDLIKRGYKTHMTWQEIYPVLDQRKKLVESERKAYVEAGQIMTMEQASIMMSQVSNAINENVKDKKERQRIALTMGKILGKLSKPLQVEDDNNE